jgi:hypothetical protein
MLTYSYQHTGRSEWTVYQVTHNGANMQPLSRHARERAAQREVHRLQDARRLCACERNYIGNRADGVCLDCASEQEAVANW